MTDLIFKNILLFLVIIAISSNGADGDKKLKDAKLNWKKLQAEKKIEKNMESSLKKVIQVIGVPPLNTVMTKQLKDDLTQREFLQYLFSILGSFNASEVSQIANTIEREIERRYDKDVYFKKLIEQPIVRQSLNSAIQILREAPLRRCEKTGKRTEACWYYANLPAKFIDWINDYFERNNEPLSAKYRIEIENFKSYVHYKNWKNNQNPASQARLNHPAIHLEPITMSALQVLFFDEFKEFRAHVRSKILQALQTFWKGPQRYNKIEIKKPIPKYNKVAYQPFLETITQPAYQGYNKKMKSNWHHVGTQPKNNTKKVTAPKTTPKAVRPEPSNEFVEAHKIKNIIKTNSRVGVKKVKPKITYVVRKIEKTATTPKLKYMKHPHDFKKTLQLKDDNSIAMPSSNSQETIQELENWRKKEEKVLANINKAIEKEKNFPYQFDKPTVPVILTPKSGRKKFYDFLNTGKIPSLEEIMNGITTPKPERKTYDFEQVFQALRDWKQVAKDEDDDTKSGLAESDDSGDEEQSPFLDKNYKLEKPKSKEKPNNKKTKITKTKDKNDKKDKAATGNEVKVYNKEDLPTITGAIFNDDEYDFEPSNKSIMSNSKYENVQKFKNLLQNDKDKNPTFKGVVSSDGENVPNIKDIIERLKNPPTTPKVKTWREMLTDDRRPSTHAVKDIVKIYDKLMEWNEEDEVGPFTKKKPLQMTTKPKKSKKTKKIKTTTLKPKHTKRTKAHTKHEELKTRPTLAMTSTTTMTTTKTTSSTTTPTTTQKKSYAPAFQLIEEDQVEEDDDDPFSPEVVFDAFPPIEQEVYSDEPVQKDPYRIAPDYTYDYTHNEMPKDPYHMAPDYEYDYAHVPNLVGKLRFN